MLLALAYEDGEEVVKLLKTITTEKGGIHVDSAGDRTITISYLRGVRRGASTAILPSPGIAALQVGWDTMVDLVNANTAKIREELVQRQELMWVERDVTVMVASRREGLVWVRRYGALIEVIWSMVGDIAVKGHQDGEVYLRRCEWCRIPFLATDKRQRFCPPPAGSKKSLCGLKYRWHKMQINPKRKEVTNGAPTAED